MRTSSRADNAPHGQAARPVLQLVSDRSVTAADECAHRGADDDIGLDAVRLQSTHHADMCESPRRAAAEHKPIEGPPLLTPT